MGKLRRISNIIKLIDIKSEHFINKPVRVWLPTNLQRQEYKDKIKPTTINA